MTDLAPLHSVVAELMKHCREAGLTVATAESCTGGLLAGVLTDLAGSSDVFERGFVTYSNAAKSELLGVPAALIERVGAVSEEVALAMADGVLAHSPADIAVSVTGVAGPGGGSADKPVGLVHFAARRRGRPARHHVHVFEDFGRDSIRFAAIRQALAMLREQATDIQPSP